MQKPYKSVRVFKNPLLERLTHVHPMTPLVLWTPFISWLVWRSLFVHQISVGALAGMAVLGIFSWTIAEYVLHRYVFHFTPSGPFQERLVYLIHGLHHDDPVDPTRLVMPPVPALILAILLYGLFRMIFGAVWVEPFFAFFLVGYLCYDYTHYAVHHFTPKTRFGKMVKQHHMIHHYVDSTLCWGVSSPLWDHVFGTTKDAQKKAQTA
jgi:sterol desaturase/sphingolipid hydroxylase (fatty acid hydroxylase superfamily)